MKTINLSFKHIKYDLPAGIVVFLVALPLCLGIALASGAPLFSGLITGIVGGMVVSLISKSSLSVSGPAAGLAAIVISSVQQLNSFETFTLAVLIAGALQLVMGIAKIGTVASYIPSNVIKGMLTAIGIIIILKQIPHALGYDKDSEGNFSFVQADGQNTFSELLNVLNFIQPTAILISLLSLVILIVWDKPVMKRFKMIPAGVVVVLLSIVINELISGFNPALSLKDDHLVAIPVHSSVTDFFSLFSLPDFSAFTNYKVYTVAFTIAVIASIETLLSLEAVDKIDPEKRISSPNRELVAQGIGNMFAGLLGGLPMTSVIVRSSANVNAGAKSSASSFIHGLLLLVCVALIPSFLNKIPLASLAAILLVTGYKLAKPSLIKEMFDNGYQQFIPFAVTILATVFSDLLTGVAIGLAVSVFFVLRTNYKNPFMAHKADHKLGEVIKIELAQEVSFLNKASIAIMLENIPENSQVIIDASKTKYIDFDVIEIIKEFRDIKSPHRNIKLLLIGFNNYYDISNVKLFSTDEHFIDASFRTPENQKSLTPEIALQILKEGNFRFMHNLKLHRNLLQQVNKTSDAQYPFAVILSCIDSRTSAELIFDQGLGDIFSIRIAGNIANEDILGSMEFACKIAGSKIIVVLGHSKCGAIKGACDHVQMGHLSGLINKLRNAVDKETTEMENRSSQNPLFVEKVASINVFQTVEFIKKNSTILNEMITKKEIAIVGAMYDIETGLVDFYEQDTVPSFVVK